MESHRERRSRAAAGGRRALDAKLTEDFDLSANWVFYGDEQGTIKLLDLRENKPHLKFSAEADINCASLAPNQSEIFYGDSNGFVGRFDLRTDQLTQKFKASPNDDFGIHALSLTGDEESLVFGDSGGNVVFASLENPQKIKIVKKGKFHQGIVLNCEIAKDKRHVITSSTDHSMKIFAFDGETGAVKQTESFHQNNGWVWGLKMLDNMNMFLAVSSDSFITVWDIAEGKVVKETENDLIEGALTRQKVPEGKVPRRKVQAPHQREGLRRAGAGRVTDRLITARARRGLLAQSVLQLLLDARLFALELVAGLAEARLLALMSPPAFSARARGARAESSRASWPLRP